jgi:hypothetical protein
LQGAKGDTGDTGPQGDVGAIGPQGLKGDTGATGTPGAIGLQGPQGLTGATGSAGAAGATGLAAPRNTVTLAGTIPGAVLNCTPMAPATSCVNTLITASCPVGMIPIGCGVFLSSVCPDGSNGVSDSYFTNTSCVVQVYNRTAVGACGPLTYTLQAQAKCLNVP